MPFFAWRQRARYRPSRTMDLPPGRAPETPVDEVPPEAPPQWDWPAVPSRHPHWWQVHRIEIHGTERRLVLIAEVRTETEAFRVAAAQMSQVRLTKWGSPARPYETPHRDPLVVVTGTVTHTEE